MTERTIIVRLPLLDPLFQDDPDRMELVIDESLGATFDATRGDGDEAKEAWKAIAAHVRSRLAAGKFTHLELRRDGHVYAFHSSSAIETY